MTFYDTRVVRSIISKVLGKKYNLRKVLGLPNLKNLPLTEEERRFMLKEYKEFDRLANKILHRLINFYEDFRIAYGKSKHGLTFQTGLGFYSEITTSKIEPPGFDDSFLLCLDRKVRNDMPIRHYISNAKTNAGEYFNVVSSIKFNQKLQDEIKVALSPLEQIIPFICCNHLTYAKNCGECCMVSGVLVLLA